MSRAFVFLAILLPGAMMAATSRTDGVGELPVGREVEALDCESTVATVRLPAQPPRG